MNVVINTLAYKKNGSGIGALISELFIRSTTHAKHPSQITLSQDSLSGAAGENIN